MGKHFVVILFASALISAIVVFMQRGERQARAKVEGNPQRDSHARVIIEDFTIYEYKNHQASETFQGRLAEFIDPDSLEILGDVLGQRHLSSKKEFLSAQEVHVNFESKGLTELVKNSKIKSTEFEREVRIGYEDNILYTEYAKYLYADRKLSSDQPVRIQSPRGEITGKRGFEYETKDQDLKIFGPMEGTLVDVPDNKKR